MIHFRRKVKIVATLGPVSSSFEMIRHMVEAGVNVFRLNFSHGTIEQHIQNIAWVRQLEKETGKIVSVLVDLQGPKLRIGDMQSIAVLEKGDIFILDNISKPGDSTRVFFPHTSLYSSIPVGTMLLLDDGKLSLEVTAVSPEKITTCVHIGGTLSGKKGVNIPNTFLPIEALTEKDKEDLQAISNLSVDWVALSFVQKPEDILALKKHLTYPCKIIAKIEKPQALKHLKEIIEEADGVMIARGDLGVEFPPEHVPVLQRQIIQACRQEGKPVIVATQMLESMIQNATPTRAEASDVATAVYEGVDAVMLSAESASGKHPLESVQMLDRIIQSVEEDTSYEALLETFSPALHHASISDGVTASAKKIAGDLKSPIIFSYTATGGTAIRVAHKRPFSIIAAMTTSQRVARFLCLVWGVYPCIIPHMKDLDEMILKAKEIGKKTKITQQNECIVITCGVPFGNPGTTNIICVETL